MDDDVFQFGSVLRKLIDDGTLWTRQKPATNHPAMLELLEASGEDIGRNPGQPAVQVGEAFWADEQVPHDEQRPTLADNFKRSRKSAILPVHSRGHDLSIHQTCL